MKAGPLGTNRFAETRRFDTPGIDYATFQIPADVDREIRNKVAVGIRSCASA